MDAAPGGKPAIIHPKHLHLHISPCSGSSPPPPLGGTPQPYPPLTTIQAESLVSLPHRSAYHRSSCLLSPPSGSTHGKTQRALRRAYYAYQGPTSQLANDLCDHYLCRTVDPMSPEYICSGLHNTELDAPFTLPDLRAAEV
ncbi:hypothetical protein HPB52_003139 [Rhipicephalus sanguineus]|uniref:Uncharacterized protein n=1 Tax=Rhipicephalus sanguineus TaxID=34632 RepID=A0A9D4SVH2_RHISA|nr:hypothetical protein HPB52_003139 [Rhipicephalus sanguineus]